MFSLKVNRLISKIFKSLEKTRLFPFTWDEKLDSLAISKSKVNPIFTKMFLQHYIVYFSYTIWQLGRAYFRKFVETKVMDIYWLCLMAFGHYVSWEGVLMPYLKRNEQVNYYRHIVQLDKNLAGIFLL